jgi:predicted site-specific integrase-resolvase
MTMPRPVKRLPDQADFLSAPKIAKELGVNQRTVTNWAAAGLIRVSTTHVTVNLYSRDDVARVLQERRGPSPAPVAAQA